MRKKSGQKKMQKRVNADYVRKCIEKNGGKLEKISADMGYNRTYLSTCLTHSRQELLPVVLDYLVANYGVDKEKALDIEPKEEAPMKGEDLSHKLDVLIEKVEILQKHFFDMHKAQEEIIKLWK